MKTEIGMSKSTEFRNQRNQGESARTAVRENSAAKPRLLKPGKAEQGAQNFDKEAIRRELGQAEAVGRRHADDDDPKVRPPSKKD
jgi:hypothetical protein